MPKAEQTVQREVSRAIEEWLLSILRFAITLDELDRAAVLAMATHMDRRTFGFPAVSRELYDLLMRATRQPSSSTS
jgi:hypothetical protein